ncbi:MAG: hypothetical protein ACPL1K_06320 [Candidatus Kryptoniota bacterium]
MPLIFCLLLPAMMSTTVFADRELPPEPSKDDITPLQFYYFNGPIWIDADKHDNWGYGVKYPYPGSWPHPLAANQLVRIYLVWTPGANFRVGFTHAPDPDSPIINPTIPVYNDWTDIRAPSAGNYWIRIDNHFGDPSFSYDGYYLVVP